MNPDRQEKMSRRNDPNKILSCGEDEAMIN